jgi:hypothetical protein
MKEKTPKEKAADEFGQAWEDACYKAGTQGIMNVLMIAGVMLMVAFVVSLLSKLFGY